MIDEKKLIEEFDKKLYAMQIVPMREVIKIIKEQPKVGEWIPVSERLPEDGYGQTFLLTVKDGKETIVTFAKYQPKYRRFNLTGARSYWKPVAWMPLPEPYRPQGARKHFNADKIRAMSDEELAEFLANFAWDNEPTKEETYEWLHSEVEE